MNERIDPPMRVIRPEECRRMRWLNGGGETIELAIAPDDATYDSLDWRLSRAHVATNGPFSYFPNIDRTLIVTSGAGLTLASGDLPSITLKPDTPPFEFAGERAIQAALIDGPVNDLNVMTRRGRFAHKMIVRRIADYVEVIRDSGILVVSLRDCDAHCEWADGGSRLRAGDYAILRDGESARLKVRPDAESLIYEIRLWPI